MVCRNHVSWVQQSLATRGYPKLYRHLCWMLLGFAGAALAAETPRRVHVVIEGLADPALSNARVSLSIGRLDLNQVSANTVRRAHRNAAAEIRTALEPFGYYRAQVHSQLLQSGQGWRAVYRVAAGAPVRISKVDVRVDGEGQGFPPLTERVRRFPLRVGQALDHQAYERGKNALVAAASDYGFFDAHLTERLVRVDLDTYQAEIHLHLASGPRYRFGALHFDNDILRPEFLRRYAEFQPGDFYDANKLLSLQQGLSDSGYFSRVDISPDLTVKDASATPIAVNLTPRPRRRYEAGAGYTTDTGVRVLAGYQQRYVNRNGHQLAVDLQYSQVRARGTASYTIPLRRPQTDHLRFFAEAAAQDDNRTGQSQSLRLGAGRTHPRFGVRETQALVLQRESFQLDRSRTTTLLIPSIGWADAAWDDPVYPTRGYRWDLTLRGAAKGLLSDVSFGQATATGKWVRAVSRRGRVLARGQVGGLLVDEFAVLPTTLRFYTGGDTTVRGFAYNQLGSVTGTDQRRSGGRYLLVSSLEYEHRLFGQWGAAVFADAGNAFRSLDDPIVYSVGVGLRWKSPVGVVRVDLASAISEPDTPVRLHIVVGPDL